jgi:hypothetical protein
MSHTSLAFFGQFDGIDMICVGLFPISTMTRWLLPLNAASPSCLKT